MSEYFRQEADGRVRIFRNGCLFAEYVRKRREGRDRERCGQKGVGECVGVSGAAGLCDCADAAREFSGAAVGAAEIVLDEVAVERESGERVEELLQDDARIKKGVGDGAWALRNTGTSDFADGLGKFCGTAVGRVADGGDGDAKKSAQGTLAGFSDGDNRGAGKECEDGFEDGDAWDDFGRCRRAIGETVGGLVRMPCEGVPEDDISWIDTGLDECAGDDHGGGFEDSAALIGVAKRYGEGAGSVMRELGLRELSFAGHGYSGELSSAKTDGFCDKNPPGVIDSVVKIGVKIFGSLRWCVCVLIVFWIMFIPGVEHVAGWGIAKEFEKPGDIVHGKKLFTEWFDRRGGCDIETLCLFGGLRWHGFFIFRSEI